MYTYFQMMEETRRTVEQNVEDLERVFPRMANVHCCWFENEADTNYLRDGARMWRPLLAKLVELGYDGPLYLEYYKDYTEEQMVDDLAFLREEMGKLRG
jgi:sugar phosphate isomerase/epimerase